MREGFIWDGWAVYGEEDWWDRITEHDGVEFQEVLDVITSEESLLMVRELSKHVPE
jgi:hypothetical protein